MSIAVVTDSTAYLPAELIAAGGLTVVPLGVAIDGVEGREGLDVSPDDVARALGARRLAVTTSRPSPAELSTVYGKLLAAGATGIVSVHLSAKLSGTYDAAVLAAADHPGLVEVVDSLSTGMGLGFPALHARGEDLAAARAAALAAVARTTTLFYVDTLEYLRRGGRIGAASALLGTALSVKPILHMADGEIVVRDKVRTATRAMGRLVDLAVEAAGESDVDIAVHHLAAPGRATELTAALTDRLGVRMKACYQTEIGAAVGAHAGPGLVSVVVHNRSTA
ncbi:DegV family protein [Rugosimonospora africana]|nr:DegV family protein [Rugosimonospora africana]